MYTCEIANLLLKVSWVASQIVLYCGDIALNRAEIAERFTRAILKLQFQGDKSCIELQRQKSPDCVNGPLHCMWVFTVPNEQ